MYAALILAWAVAGSPETVAAKPVSTDAASTTITSQRMTVRNQDNKAIFEGAVVLTKGNLVVHSDTMVVFFKPAQAAQPNLERSVDQADHTKNAPPSDKDKNAGGGTLPIMGNRSVKLIEATGRVRITKEDGQATCRKAVYHGDEDKIVLTGDPVAWQKGTRVTGQRIIMYLAEDRSVVEGGSQVMIQPEGGIAN